jgi:hypothetical protein
MLSDIDRPYWEASGNGLDEQGKYRVDCVRSEGISTHNPRE